MAIPEDVYQSMCKLAQKLIDQMEENLNEMTEVQFIELQDKIYKIHKFMRENNKTIKT